MGTEPGGSCDSVRLEHCVLFVFHWPCVPVFVCARVFLCVFMCVLVHAFFCE